MDISLLISIAALGVAFFALHQTRSAAANNGAEYAAAVRLRANLQMQLLDMRWQFQQYISELKKTTEILGALFPEESEQLQARIGEIESQLKVSERYFAQLARGSALAEDAVGEIRKHVDDLQGRLDDEQNWLKALKARLESIGPMPPAVA